MVETFVMENRRTQEMAANGLCTNLNNQSLRE